MQRGQEGQEQIRLGARGMDDARLNERLAVTVRALGRACRQHDLLGGLPLL